MAKRKMKKPRMESSRDVVDQHEGRSKEPEMKNNIMIEIEQRANAMRAICNSEITHLQNQLNLMRSYFSKEQLNTPLVDFLKENCPNTSLIKRTEDGEYELEWKAPAILLNDADIFPQNRGIQFSSKAARESFLTAASMHIPDFMFEENWNAQMRVLQDPFQTPGVNSQQSLSVGTASKTLRLPKHGEMLLSVHGSPLGLYREGGMEAINESDC